MKKNDINNPNLAMSIIDIFVIRLAQKEHILLIFTLRVESLNVQLIFETAKKSQFSAEE